MTGDIIAQLRGLHRYATGLHDLIAQAQASAPRRVEATDRSGAVRITLGPEGLPESIRVEPGWYRRLDAADFGDAVVEAYQTAAGERMAAWSDAIRDQNWQARAERLRDDLDDEPEAERADPLPPAMRDAVATVRPRPLEMLVEDMLRAFDSVEELAAGAPLLATGTGSDSSGRLAVTLSKAGLTSCTADAHWVRQQSGRRLTTALSEAVAAARADLARAAETPNPARQLDQLLAEALALFADPQRFLDS